MCDRCHQPILDGEEFEVRPVMSPSGPGNNVILHKRLCQRPPTQTSPASPSGARWGEAAPTPRAGRP